MSHDFHKVDSKCKVLCLETNKTADAEVLEFKEKAKLIVVLNKAIKLTLNWNGRTYLGKGSGLEFTSDGPSITTYKTGR